jgi:hypothetical protein
VAWWRLKALAGNHIGGDLLPVSGTVNGHAVTVPVLAPDEREALIAAAGPTADQPHVVLGGLTTAPGVIERLLKLMADGTGPRLEQQGRSVLAGRSGANGGVLASFGNPTTWLLVGVAALVLIPLFRRKG